MKIETHVHTSESSPCANADAMSLVAAYARAGYDAMVITDHFDEVLLTDYGCDSRTRIERYLKGYRAAVKAGSEFGIRVWLGVEIRLEPDSEDFLIYGVDEEFLFENPHLCRMTQQELYELCHANGAVLFQAHPFREPCQPREAAYLDGVEFNQRPNSGNHNELLDQWIQGYPHLRRISGSDCHGLDQVGYGGIDLIADVKNVRELAGEMLHGNYDLIVDIGVRAM